MSYTELGTTTAINLQGVEAYNLFDLLAQLTRKNAQRPEDEAKFITLIIATNANSDDSLNASLKVQIGDKEILSKPLIG